MSPLGYVRVLVFLIIPDFPPQGNLFFQDGLELPALQGGPDRFLQKAEIRLEAAGLFGRIVLSEGDKVKVFAV